MWVSHNLKPDAEGVFVFVPIGAEHLEMAYLGGGAHMAAYARTDVVVANANKADGVGNISGQATGIDAFGQVINGDELEGDREIFIDEPLHLALNLLFFLATGLVVEVKTHLALLSLDVRIEGALTAEETYHGLI